MKVRDFLIRAHLSAGFNQNYMKRLVEFLQVKKHLPDKEELDLIITKMSAHTKQRFLEEFNGEVSQKRLLANRDFAPIVTIFDENYPQLLKEASQPPAVLFYRGNLDLVNHYCLGVVGARKSTAYGANVLRQLMPDILRDDLTTVSGLAAGIDGLTHQLTLANHGHTIGVIGTGLDRAYPKRKYPLQEEVAQKGLLLTEYGLGDAPKAYHFPARNRIIAGLSQAVLVVEAKKRSGSLITANLALEDNRSVLAVPGSISADNSDGCNELISAGAKPVLSAKDILEEYQYL